MTEHRGQESFRDFISKQSSKEKHSKFFVQFLGQKTFRTLRNWLLTKGHMVVRFISETGKQAGRTILSAVQQTDKRVDLWECYAMLNAIRISGKLGGKTSTFTFIFKIFILTCICYSTFLPGIIFFFYYTLNIRPICHISNVKSHCLRKPGRVKRWGSADFLQINTIW